jgi:choline-glycine betaine transporter
MLPMATLIALNLGFTVAGAIQIESGLQIVAGIGEVGNNLLIGIIAVLTVCFVISAVSGVAKGIQWLSNINMVLALLLALFLFVVGPTVFILDLIPTSLGTYVGDLAQMSARTGAEGSETATWLSSWTVFYWAWWISWAPFVGMFIARISRGRTIRQFVAGVLFVPSVVSTFWFAIFGGGAIGLQQRAEAAGDQEALIADIVDGGPNINFDTVLFQFLDALPMPAWLTVVLVVLTIALIGIFFVTGADSASIVMGMLSENGTEHPSKKTVLFWGVAVGAVAAVMLLAGGSQPASALNGLKNITIVSAVPFVLVMLLLCVALWKDLARDPLVLRRDLADHVLTESVASGIEQHAGEPFELRTVETPDTVPG